MPRCGTGGHSGAGRARRYSVDVYRVAAGGVEAFDQGALVLDARNVLGRDDGAAARVGIENIVGHRSLLRKSERVGDERLKIRRLAVAHKLAAVKDKLAVQSFVVAENHQPTFGAEVIEVAHERSHTQ